MQIGNEELDGVCKDVIVPALKASNLDPKRVDKHNRGGLLKSEIKEFINQAEIIVADLTNERPNCYLEIGYAMGRDKYSNLILTAREDHNPDSPNYVKGGPKVHFDLTGYDILWWKQDNLSKFKEDLEKRIKRRLTTISANPKPLGSPLDMEWIGDRQKDAFSEFVNRDDLPFMEVEMALYDSTFDVKHAELLQIAEEVQIHTTGWPIGVVLHVDAKRPKPTNNGIAARIISQLGSGYDYWALRRDGQFYMLRGESSRKSGTICFDIIILRITEVMLYATRLYGAFGASPDARVFIKITHGGLKDHFIVSDRRRIIDDSYKSEEDIVSSQIETALEDIKPKIVDLVEKITQPLFALFDFFNVPRSSLEEIVTNFVEGKVD